MLIFGKKTINSEVESILSNHIWELCKFSKGSKSIFSKWIFTKKMKPNGTIDRFNARLVIRDFC